MIEWRTGRGLINGKVIYQIVGSINRQVVILHYFNCDDLVELHSIPCDFDYPDKLNKGNKCIDELKAIAVTHHRRLKLEKILKGS